MSDNSRRATDTADVRDAKGRFGPGTPGRQRGARVTRAAEALLVRNAAAWLLRLSPSKRSSGLDPEFG
jgi:hypothetical protein